MKFLLFHPSEEIKEKGEPFKNYEIPSVTSRTNNGNTYTLDRGWVSSVSLGEHHHRSQNLSCEGLYVQFMTLMVVCLNVVIKIIEYKHKC